jgi:hypothetical protein
MKAAATLLALALVGCGAADEPEPPKTLCVCTKPIPALCDCPAMSPPALPPKRGGATP